MQDYINIAIEREEEESRPQTICVHCPISVWLRTSHSWTCYCPATNSLSYGKKQSPIEICSEQQLEILKLQSEREE